MPPLSLTASEVAGEHGDCDLRPTLPLPNNPKLSDGALPSLVPLCWLTRQPLGISLVATPSRKPSLTGFASGCRDKHSRAPARGPGCRWGC